MEQKPILEKCCNCGKYPTVREAAGGLYYAQCNCGKWSPYEALGMTTKGAILHWDELNKPIQRNGNPRKNNEMRNTK